MDIVVVPVLNDNYAYLVIDEASKTCACVDPVEPEKVLEAAAKHGAKVTHVLTTHAHWDHSGGNDKIAELLGPDLVVVGGKNDKIPKVTLPVGHDDVVELGALRIRVLDTPCHTPGHICFYVSHVEGGRSAVFTGDTLFVGGCGNFNSGTPEQMHHALCNVLGKLHGDTFVYVGHNYTAKNLAWAEVVEPGNERIKGKLAYVNSCVKNGQPTVPSTIDDELATNPFMRCTERAVQEWADSVGDPVATLLRVRQGKDEWGRSR